MTYDKQREALIEKTAKAIYEHSETNEWGTACECGRLIGNDLARHQAEIALAVFEESQKPGEDERAFANALRADAAQVRFTMRGRETDASARLDRAADLIDGFRRPVSPTECQCPTTLGWHTIDCPANRSVKPEGESSEAHAYSRGFWDGVHHVEPQVEPTVAELSKLANAAHRRMVDEVADWYGFSHQRDAWESGYFDGYRDRAAAVTNQGEGGNRG